MAAKKSEKATEKTAVSSDNKKAALETVISRIERECGKGSIMRLGENVNMNVSAVSTGSLSLDFALGVGGIPRGRITEIYGPESSGKTTILLLKTNDQILSVYLLLHFFLNNWFCISLWQSAFKSR